MVAGFAEVIDREETLVAAARYVPNRQFLRIPFRSELSHCRAEVQLFTALGCAGSRQRNHDRYFLSDLESLLWRLWCRRGIERVTRPQMLRERRFTSSKLFTTVASALALSSMAASVRRQYPSNRAGWPARGCDR